MAFEEQINPEILKRIEELAASSGQPIHLVVEEALKDLLAKNGVVRDEIWSHYEASLRENDELYRRLAQ